MSTNRSMQNSVLTLPLLTKVKMRERERERERESERESDFMGSHAMKIQCIRFG